MPATVVTCSLPQCKVEASYKVAFPWQDGSFTELQTLGYTCPAHAEKVIAGILQRPKDRYPVPSEIRLYTLPRA